jgi:ribokinase
VDIVDSSGQWRYLEDVSAEMLLTEGDMRACRHLLLPGRWVSVQLTAPFRSAHVRAGNARVAHRGQQAGKGSLHGTFKHAFASP